MKLCKDCRHCQFETGLCWLSWPDPIEGRALKGRRIVEMRNVEWACGASGRGFEPKAAPKPRRMKGCKKSWSCLRANFCLHANIHDEGQTCDQTYKWGDDECPSCQPIDAEPQAINEKHFDAPGCSCGTGYDPDCEWEGHHKPPEPQRPDPGEGWRLLEQDETARIGDECLDPIGKDWLPADGFVGVRQRDVCYKIRRRAEVEQLTARITDLLIEKNGMAEQVCDQLAELARLRALCAARPKSTDDNDYCAFVAKLFDWNEKIDAAGRGEGKGNG